MTTPEFINQLQVIFPSGQVVTDISELKEFGTDWTKLKGDASLLFLPRTVDEVATFLRHCSKHHVAVVPSGGRTGLAGGAVAEKKEAVLSLSRMARIKDFDPAAQTVRVQAGVTTEAVHEFAATHGLVWPVDLAAKGSSTIGGNIATNAGGVKVIRYGMTRKWVTALQIVLMDGSIIELNRGLEKNNTGYDLLQLIVGSEGTLAVVTEATLKLCDLPGETKVLLFSVPSLQQLLELFLASREAKHSLLAFEFFSHACREIVEKQLHRKNPLSATGGYYALVEIESAGTNLDSWLESLLSRGVVSDGTLASSLEEGRKLWALREGITESIAKTAPVRKYDLGLPISGCPAFLEKALAQRHEGFELFLFGHLGDGSPHLNLVKRAEATQLQFETDCKAFEKWLYPELRAASGSAAAEHGVGLLKKEWVSFSRSTRELDLFHAIKNAFDPKGLLNPGKLLP